MDIGNDELTLSANLDGAFDGLDNEAINFDTLEQFLEDVDLTLNLPEDPTSSFNDVRLPLDHREGARQSHMKQPLPAHMGTANQQHPMMTSSQAMLGQHQLTADPITTQAQMKNNQLNNTQLPDSPPDSGSEPYSPPEGEPDPNSCSVKSSMAPTMYNPTGQAMHAQQAAVAAVIAHQNGQQVSPPHNQHLQQQQQNNLSPVSMHASVHKSPYSGYSNTEPPKLNHPSHMSVGMGQSGAGQLLPPQYTPQQSQQQPTKKRKFSDSPTGTVNPAMLHNMGLGVGMMEIKQEPEINHGLIPGCGDDDYGYDLTASEVGSSFLDSTFQVIKWQNYEQKKWATTYDINAKETPFTTYRVDADKGFNFSVPDDTFVCQKKNHFQVTCHVNLHGNPEFVKDDNGKLQKIDSYFLHFYGIKVESPSQSIRIEQSQSDRSKKGFHPVRVDLGPDNMSKVTVGRLHFSETTTNNMRKKGKPNPDQRYFMLVVALHAHYQGGDIMIAAQNSEKIIVRASNPGQFESDVDVLWQKGQTQDSVFHAGRVGINTDRPDEALTVHGNVKLTGHITQPSDQRAKKDIKPLDSREQLKNVAALNVYKYQYDDNYAQTAGLSEDELEDTGVLAQEVLDVLPDAVRETGDVILATGETINNFLVVNKDRIYMENIGAVKELCKLTDNLENRIDELEKINKKLTKLKRAESLRSSLSVQSLSTLSTMSRNNSERSTLPPKKDLSNTGGIVTISNGMLSKEKKKCSSPQHRHQHRHHHQHGEENGRWRRDSSLSSSSSGGSKQTPETLCSNRFVQITIIILVLVMAFCLISITTLYILEKQNQQYGRLGFRGNISQSANLIADQASDYADNYNGTGESVTNQSPYVPPSAVSLRHNTTSSRSVYANNVSDSSGNSDNITAKASDALSADGQLIPPRCLRDSCSSFCCLEPQNDPAVISRKTVKPPDPDVLENDAESAGKPVVFIPDVPYAELTPDHQMGYDEGQVMGPEIEIPGEMYGNQPDMVLLNDPTLGYQADLSNHILNRRSADSTGAPPPLLAVLRIHEINQTIGNHFCMDDACLNQISGNYSYLVPVSQYFPLTSITLDVMVDPSLEVFYCPSKLTDLCHDARLPPGPHYEPLEFEGMYAWSLPVGYYTTSQYEFRVTTKTENNVCDLPDVDVGQSYAVYNVQFQRMCGN